MSALGSKTLFNWKTEMQNFLPYFLLLIPQWQLTTIDYCFFIKKMTPVTCFFLMPSHQDTEIKRSRWSSHIWSMCIFISLVCRPFLINYFQKRPFAKKQVFVMYAVILLELSGIDWMESQKVCYFLSFMVRWQKYYITETLAQREI